MYKNLPFQSISKIFTKVVNSIKKQLFPFWKRFKKKVTELFAQEKKVGTVEGIIGNVFQTAFGKDVYPSTAEKAANLLYFMVKNHPFTDGNKRSGAFAFVWFLRKAGLLRASLSPEALTALTLLIAESNPRDKEKMVGLVVMLIK